MSLSKRFMCCMLAARILFKFSLLAYCIYIDLYIILLILLLSSLLPQNTVNVLVSTQKLSRVSVSASALSSHRVFVNHQNRDKSGLS